VGAVQNVGRTLGDPFLQFKAPENVHRIWISVEDLARRGGPQYGYRLIVYRAAQDFRASIGTPFLNIPAGGTALVTLNIARRGYNGPLQVEPVNLPPGITAAGGDIPAEVADPNNRATSRNAILTLTAAAGAKLNAEELSFRVVGSDEQGMPFDRRAGGIGYSIGVAGATDQGVVDRQRPLTGTWLGYALPAALSDPQPATLALRLENVAQKEAGYQFLFRWTWATAGAMQNWPDTVNVDVPNFTDLRVIEMAVDPKDRKTGTFLVTSTKNTLPALYNVVISGRLTVNGARREIYAPLVAFPLPAMDEENKNAQPTVAR
jgi:hypothetical protein